MNTHTFWIIVGAVAAAIFGLAGCTTGSGPAVDAKPTPTPSVNHDQKFLAAVDAAQFTSWVDKAPTDEELLALPPQWCTAVEQGHSVDWIFNHDQGALYPVGWDWGTHLAEANELLVIAVTEYCPQWRGGVLAQLRESGAY